MALRLAPTCAWLSPPLLLVCVCAPLASSGVRWSCQRARVLVCLPVASAPARPSLSPSAQFSPHRGHSWPNCVGYGKYGGKVRLFFFESLAPSIPVARVAPVAAPSPKPPASTQWASTRAGASLAPESFQWRRDDCPSCAFTWCQRFPRVPLLRPRRHWGHRAHSLGQRALRSNRGSHFGIVRDRPQGHRAAALVRTPRSGTQSAFLCARTYRSLTLQTTRSPSIAAEGTNLRPAPRVRRQPHAAADQ